MLRNEAVYEQALRGETAFVGLALTCPPSLECLTRSLVSLCAGEEMGDEHADRQRVSGPISTGDYRDATSSLC